MHQAIGLLYNVVARRRNPNPDGELGRVFFFLHIYVPRRYYTVFIRRMQTGADIYIYIYKGASPAPLPGGRARVRPVGKRKKVFGVVRNEYYGQVDQLKNSCGSHPPVIYIYCLQGGCATEFSTPSPAYPWKGAWSHRVRTAQFMQWCTTMGLCVQQNELWAGCKPILFL